jgi:MarR family transcriptional regulator, organic hydroperoxide resistance regulator
MGKNDYVMEDKFGFLIGKTYKLCKTFLQKLIEREGFDITIEQWLILSFLFHKDGQPQVLLTKIAEKDKTSITRIIDDLENKKYVHREPGRIDRREKEVYITEKGRTFVENKMAIFRREEKEFLKDISAKDFETMKNVLKKIISNILQNKMVCPYHHELNQKTSA